MERRDYDDEDAVAGVGGDDVSPGFPSVLGLWVQSCPASGRKCCLHQ